MANEDKAVAKSPLDRIQEMLEELKGKFETQDKRITALESTLSELADVPNVVKEVLKEKGEKTEGTPWWAPLVTSLSKLGIALLARQALGGGYREVIKELYRHARFMQMLDETIAKIRYQPKFTALEEFMLRTAIRSAFGARGRYVIKYEGKGEKEDEEETEKMIRLLEERVLGKGSEEGTKGHAI